jgi:hypothetical protein
MKKHAYKIFIIVIFSVIFTISCPGKPAPMTETDVFQMDTYENIDVMVEFMDEIILEVKHGHQAINPFLTLQYKLSFRRIIVFNCQIENNSERPVHFELKTIELTYSGITDHAHNKNFIMSYFDIYQDDDDVADWEHRKKEAAVKQYVMGQEYTIQPGDIIQGYLVFMDKFPQHGDAELVIPIFETNETVITTFKFPYVFNIY